MTRFVDRLKLILPLAAIALLTVETSGADLFKEFPLECRVSEPPPYRGPQHEESVLIIERATTGPSGAIFSYPKDRSDTRTGGNLFPQFGYFHRVTVAGERLHATDSSGRDRLELRREPLDTLRLTVTVGSNRNGGTFDGTCRHVTLAQSRFPFRDTPWPPPAYAGVALYQYNFKLGVSDPIYEDGKFAASVVKSVQLNDDQIRRMVAATTGAHPDHPRAACFIPRHAFVFLDEKGQPLAFAEVCFECGNHRLSNSERNHVDLGALAEIVKETGIPISMDPDDLQQ